jgi:hypothetical protein
MITLNTNLKEIDLEDGSWMDLAQNRVRWWVLVLAMLNLEVLLPGNYLVTSTSRYLSR